MKLLKKIIAASRKFGFILFTTYCCAGDLPTLTQSQIDPKVLSQFTSDIAEEVAKNFHYQNDQRTRRNTREYGYSFFKMLKGDFTYSSPPPFLQQLGALVC